MAMTITYDKPEDSLGEPSGKDCIDYAALHGSLKPSGGIVEYDDVELEDVIRLFDMHCSTTGDQEVVQDGNVMQEHHHRTPTSDRAAQPEAPVSLPMHDDRQSPENALQLSLQQRQPCECAAINDERGECKIKDHDQTACTLLLVAGSTQPHLASHHEDAAAARCAHAADSVQHEIPEDDLVDVVLCSPTHNSQEARSAREAQPPFASVHTSVGTC
jgi:hypothetical protein